LQIQTERRLAPRFNVSWEKRAVVIPEYSEIDVEIIKNNMRTVNMSREEYFEILKKV
jgi:hypothetical protein